jgi:DNA polymerase-3 subunit alpha
MDRLKFEYNAIIEMGFEGYYLLVEGYANSVKRRGIARGSGGGSLIAFLLNIVDIDPIQYGLYFERFIDVGALDLLKDGTITRKELKVPDFDLDFGRYDREVVIQSIIKQHGQENFVSLGQFGYIWDKTAVKDVGKVLGIDFEVTNQITKAMDDETIQEAIESGKLKRYLDEYPKLFDYAKKLAGLPKSFGIHPCGRAITTGLATDYTAIAVNKETIVMQGDMHDAEDLGIVKIDALGLRTVDVIYDTLDMIGKGYDYIAPQFMNFNDPKVLELFCEGNTEGMFQFESSGMRQTLKKMKPSGLDDLGVANALFRPGSMKFIDTYVKRKNGDEPVIYTHPDLEPILKVTYGIIVFQEQLIEIGRFAGMRNPDLLRQATGKKDIKKMNKAKPELEAGLKKKGWTDAQVDELWNIMLDFAKYSFNKSHSYAYGMIAYITAFLKTYHPTEFICACFNSFIGTNSQDKYERITGIYGEAKRLQVPIKFPTIDESSDKCYINKDGVLVYGLAMVKVLGAETASHLANINKHGNNEHDFVRLMVDIFENVSIGANQLDILIRLDYFKKFGKKEVLLEVFRTMADTKKADTEKYPEFATWVETIRIEKVHKRTKEVTIKETTKTHKKLVAYSTAHKESTKLERIQNAIDYADAVKANPPQNIAAWEQIQFEVEKLGYAVSTWDVHSSLYIILDFENLEYTPKARLFQLSTGIETVAKISKKKFWNSNDEQQLFPGDILQMLEMVEKDAWKKETVTINGYTKERWAQTPDRQEWHIERVKLIRKSPLRNADKCIQTVDKA